MTALITFILAALWVLIDKSVNKTIGVMFLMLLAGILNFDGILPMIYSAFAQ